MRLGKYPFILFYLLLLLSVGGCAEHIKEPSVAGSFYPSDPKVLRNAVDRFLAQAEDKQVEGKLIALLSPHAGYLYSGRVAAHSYRHLKGKNIETVILIGPSHHKTFNGASVYTKGVMRTPLGDIKINEKIARSLINENAHIRFYPEAFEKEHSLEVQLPFLQVVLKDFTIVPILISSPTKESYEELTKKLIGIIGADDKTILVASTDLSHYHDYDTAVKKDSKTIDVIERMAIDELEQYLMTGECEMCGGYPVIYTLAVARGLGATNGTLFKYANSGDVSGSKGNVVGYSAVGIYKSPLTKEEKDRLLSLAKDTIYEFITHGKIHDTEIKNSKLAAMGAAFVTINRNGRLRGCIGNIKPVMPLYKSVITNAVSASSKDHRFQPMKKEELKDMEVEVSVLSPLEPVFNVEDIVIGKHGLYLVYEQTSSVFLPQVPVEFGWDLNTYLENLSLKAGLPKDAWKTAQLFTFTAEVIK